jgi:ribose transport system substrate-binding protein
MNRFGTASAFAIIVAFTPHIAGAVEYPAPKPLTGESQAPMPPASKTSKPLQIAFLPPASTLNYYQPIREGIKAIAEPMGAGVVEMAPEDGADTYAQAGMIQDAISRGVDAIIITTHDDNAAAPVLKKAVDAGIIVVIVNSDIPSSPTPVHAVVGYNQRGSMHALGQYVTKLAGAGKLEVGYLEGLPGYHNTERMEGFLSGIDPAKVEVVGHLSGSWTVDGGNTASMDLLHAHSEIKALVAANDDMAIGAGLAGKALKMKLMTTGVDGQTAALEAVAAGEMTATVDTSPYVMGEIAMQVVLDTKSGKFKGGWVETPTSIPDQSNVLEILKTPKMLSPAPSKQY